MKKKLVPEIRFKEFEEEWDPTKIKRMTSSISSGKSVNSIGVSVGLDRPAILKTSSVSQGVFMPLENKGIVEEEVKLAKCKVKSDSIIVSRMNTPLLVGESAYISKDYDNLFLPDRLWLIRLNPNIDTKFVAITLVSTRIKHLLTTIATGTSATMKNISQPSFFSLSLNIPSLPEQRKISTFLSLVDRRLAIVRQQVQVLGDWKRGVMQQLIREKRNEWEFHFADKIFKNISNKKHNGDLPVLAITQDEGAIFRNDLNRHIHSSQKSVASYKIVEPGDFIISLRSFQGGIEYSTIKGIASPAYTILQPRMPIDDNFYRFYLKYPDFISRLDEASIGIRDGRQISYTTFSELKLPYPPPEEQTRIADILTTIDARITAAQQEETGWKTWKKGLLQKMMV